MYDKKKVLFLVSMSIFSNVFSGNGCGKGHVEEKEKKEEVTIVKMSNMQKIYTLRATIYGVIRNKGDINAKYKLVAESGRVNEATLLEFAVNYYDAKSVKKLLENGANSNINFTIDHDKRKPLQSILVHLKSSVYLFEYEDVHKRICQLLTSNINSNTLTT